MMRLETVIFNLSSKFARMARVLTASAAVNSPLAPLTVHRLTEDDSEIGALRATIRRKKLLDNARKTKHHKRIIQAARDGELLGMLDVDMLVTGDLTEIAGRDFDVAVTLKPPGSVYWFNSGVVFVRVSEATRWLYRRWYDTVCGLLVDPIEREYWRGGYGGINQSAFGKLMETGELQGLNILELPCAEWNSIRETWHEFDDRTKAVHLLGQLQTACLRCYRGQPNTAIAALTRIWKSYEARRLVT